jgi:hypothetical protein
VAVRYLTIAGIANLGWEVLQLPLYTLWQTATLRVLADAVVHCTAGDVILLAAAPSISLLAAGDRGWPGRSYARIALLATLLGIAFTIFSEWLNVEVRRSWAYAPAMPLLPLFGTGLSPLLQWVVIPPAAFALARPRLERSLSG